MDAILQELFSQTDSTNSVKLVPWCVSTVVPLNYMNKALATAVQQRENSPATTTAPESDGSQALASSDSPAHQVGSPPLPVPPMLDIPFVGTPTVSFPFAGFMVNPMHIKGDCSLSGTPGDQCRKQIHVDSQDIEVRSEHSSTKGDQNPPKWYQRLGLVLTHRGRELPVLLSVQPRPPLIPMMVQWWKPLGAPGIRTVRVMPTTVEFHLTQTHPERTWPTQIWSQPLGIVWPVQTWMR